MSLRDRLARYWRGFQPQLLEALEVEVGPLGEPYEQLIQGFEFVRVERLLWSGPVAGRPAKDRVALAQSFLAKAVFKLATTRDLIERLESDDKLRRLCGWPSACAVPSEATFSRAFAEFAETSLRLRCRAGCTKRWSSGPWAIIWSGTSRATRLRSKLGRSRCARRQMLRSRLPGGSGSARESTGRGSRATWSANGRWRFPRCWRNCRSPAMQAASATPEGTRYPGSAGSCTSIQPTAVSP